MAYEGFPAISLTCPVCGGVDCAVYRGYYTRTFVCTDMEFSGELVIRTGYCRREERRFALVPDFVIYRRRISRLSLERLLECHRSSAGRLQAAIDEWVGGLHEEFDVPRSTAWTYLKLAASLPP
jgi:hypothetical protein